MRQYGVIQMKYNYKDYIHGAMKRLGFKNWWEIELNNKGYFQKRSERQRAKREIFKELEFK